MVESENPLLAPSELDYGMPDWHRITPAHYLHAARVGMAEQRREIDAITRQRSLATFENTLQAWEASGVLLERALHAFFTVSAADATPEIQDAEAALAPELAAHSDAIQLDAALYARVRLLWGQRQDLDLSAEQAYLLERRYREMTAAGAGLDDAAKARMSEINERLSVLTTTFERNLLADTTDRALLVTDASELAGLDDAGRQATAAAAVSRQVEGHLFTLPLFTGHPALSSLTDRGVRSRIMAASQARGTTIGEHANGPVVLEIVRLRAERAGLLGRDTHAAVVTAEETAKRPEAVVDLLRRLAPAAARNARDERARLQERAAADGIDIEAQDWALYAERVRAEEHDVDMSALRAYFEAERVLHDGVFAAASMLYGVRFTERPDLPGYHPDVRVFEVFEADGAALGLFALDLYARDTKRGGAWMNEIVPGSGLRGTKPVVMNNLNVTKPGSGPTLLTFDETATLFHEFGHALHGLFALAEYPHLAGTNVFRDFVEFPSQVNEMWMLHPDVLPRYAVHTATGAPLDQAIADRLRAAAAFNQGFLTSEYLAAAWLDFAWHGLDSAAAAEVHDVAQFERTALADIGLDDPAVPPRYRSTYFQHVFAGGYSAGYYSYIWSEVLDADTVQWFEEHGGLTRANGQRFRDRLLAVAGTQDPLDAYRDFRGRNADIAPLLSRRGLD